MEICFQHSKQMTANKRGTVEREPLPRPQTHWQYTLAKETEQKVLCRETCKSMEWSFLST